MTSKFVILAVLITLAYAHGRDLSNPHTSNALEKSEKEGRTLDIPIIGTFLLLAFKIASLVISKGLSLLQYKLKALSFASSLVGWLFGNYIPVIVGTVVVVGLCVLTSSFYSEPVYEIDQHLIQAARSLDQGIVKYGRFV